MISSIPEEMSSSMQTVCRRILSLSLRSSSSSVSASCRRHMSSDSSNYADFKAVTVMKPSDHVINVELNRPEKMNAMNNVMWGEIGQVFRTIDKVNSSFHEFYKLSKLYVV